MICLKKLNKKSVCFFYIFFLLIGLLLNQYTALPSNISITTDDIEQNQFVKAYLKNGFLYKVEKKQNGGEKLDIEVKLLGLIPFKTVTASIVPEIKLIPGGSPIGVKINSKGLLVVGFSDVQTEEGYKQSPAAISGIEIGDLIEEAQSQKLENVYDLSDIVKGSKGKEIKLKVKRKNETKLINIKPLKSKNGEFKIGLWIRDSTSGIGTLTYYDPNSNKFGALGHPINDVDTGMLFPIRNGNIFNANIIAVEQGLRGKPGELKGIFVDDEVIGEIEKNTSCGIYGRLLKVYNNNIYRNAIPIAHQYEVVEGPASILVSVDGNTVKEYDIIIEKITQQTKPSSKSMIIRITDPELLSKTGGIVQGMSGSPILQNGKIIGAITHVFINRPDMGYGIYIEWMLKEQGYDI